MKNRFSRSVLCLITALLICSGLTEAREKKSSMQGCPVAMEKSGLASQLCFLRDFKSKRSSSWDQSGKNKDWIEIAPGQKYTLLAEMNPGCIKHFYWAYVERNDDIRLNMFRGVVLRAFWDNSGKPSIEVPLGDFFGVSNGMIRSIKSLAFTTNSGLYDEAQFSWGFNCYLAMPFASGAIIELENQGEHEAKIWFHIDYELYDLPSAIPPAAGRLHAVWNREDPTQKITHDVNDWKDAVNASGKHNYTIADIEGDGQFVGYFFTIVNRERQWWGEGDDMVFIDGEKYPPSIHGTGTEEIFGGGACPVNEYTGPYTGFHCIENRSDYRWYGTTGAYRFYLADPLRFRKSIRVTLEHGHANDKANDYSTVAFWYQKGVNKSLPPLAPLSKRQINFK